MNESDIKIAALQMVSTEDVNANLKQAEKLIAEAASKGASLVVLPENFAVFNAKELYHWAQPDNAENLKSAVSGWAKDHGVWIIAGTLPQSNQYPETQEQVSDRRVRTSSIVFSPAGEQTHRYDKIHLFDVDVEDAHGSYRESETIEPGTDVTLAKIDFEGGASVTVGLSVCYDLRFPELYRELTKQGADVFVVPAAFTWETGKAHWESLLRARAIENQCFVVAANQGGQHTKTRQTWGHSVVIDPWGEVLASLADSPGVVIASLDLNKQRQLRSQMPVLQHRRL